MIFFFSDDMKCQVSVLLLLACNVAFAYSYKLSKYCDIPNCKFSKDNAEMLFSNLTFYFNLWPHDVTGSEEEDPHPCKRTCIANEEPKICEYTFKIENYYTMTKACHDCPYNQTDCLRTDCIPGDGNYRSVVAVNRMLPGPAIEVLLHH